MLHSLVKLNSHDQEGFDHDRLCNLTINARGATEGLGFPIDGFINRLSSIVRKIIRVHRCETFTLDINLLYGIDESPYALETTMKKDKMIGNIIERCLVMKILRGKHQSEDGSNIMELTVRSDKKIAQDNMERLGIEELKNRCYMELSGGQQQRVLLARAMCATKKLLLLDEPVTGLDPVATNEMYNLIKLINLCDNTSVIMISHDIHAAVRYATHILHLGHKQLFFGTAAEYRQSDLARRFVGGGRG